MAYPTCRFCHCRYANPDFLVQHIRRRHFLEMILFVQQRWRFIRHMQKTKLTNAINLIRSCMVRKRFLKLRRAVNIIKKRYLKYTYSPWHQGSQRAHKNWKHHLALPTLHDNETQNRVQLILNVSI
jgi:hypothetical protein